MDRLVRGIGTFGTQGSEENLPPLLTVRMVKIKKILAYAKLSFTIIPPQVYY